MFCYRCGKELQEHHAFCAACGTKTAAAGPPIAAPVQPGIMQPSPGWQRPHHPAAIPWKKQLSMWVLIVSAVLNLPAGLISILCRQRGMAAVAAGDETLATRHAVAGMICTVAGGVLGVVSVLIYLIA